MLKKVLAVVVAIFALFPAFTQDKKKAAISGFVHDSRTKSPLFEAVVTLQSDAFTGQRFAITDSSGKYLIDNLPKGTYTISFEMEGYKKFTKENIQLPEGMSLGVSFQMAREDPERKDGNHL
jgi:hypothetical protein